MAAITLKDVVKRYGTGPKANQVIHGVNAEIADGEFIVIVGPSGCGKSTLLRMVAGLEEISGGTIAIGGRVVNDIEPSERDIAMVFQNYALYPHMSVFDNMAYGLKIAKVPLDEIKTRVDKAAKILELGPFLQRKPRERDALLHAAAELAGIEIGEARKMHEIEIVGGPGEALGLRQPFHLERPRDVLDGGEPGKQRELLEHHAAIGAGRPDRGAVEAQLAAARGLEAADDVQERALAAARRPDDGDELVLVNGQRQAIDGGDAPVLDRERLVEIAHL